MALRIKFIGLLAPDRSLLPETDFVCRALSLVSSSPVSISQKGLCDLTVVYPYIRPFRSTVMGAGIETLMSRSPLTINDQDALRYLLRIPKSSRILVISPENLDRRPWEMLGHLLIGSSLPRLTSWPQELDPLGFRVPYWWNYVDWPEIPRPGYDKVTRLGRLYKLDQLGSPRVLGPEWHDRLNKAVWLTQHKEFPRQQVLDHLSRGIKVDVLSNVPHGQKFNVLQKYKYCVVTENSTGYGYETEKTPDAVTAGCVPIGFIANPWSDFNTKATFFDVPREPPEKLPALLKRAPQLDGLLEYLGKVLD